MFTESRANAHLLHYSSTICLRYLKCASGAMTAFYNNNIYTDQRIVGPWSPGQHSFTAFTRGPHTIPYSAYPYL